ncbi:pseudouridine synthase-like protein TruD/Pus7 [Sporormia fimetaria CBS 119925]|uniref:Pseudouridine synthase-like protein TruD/Pus7 n=1 Tax=Sporormia fimetaria CBS 119925 TaxID=1340428 RepID=A0A6A6VFZ2_9PLEO|nr:pseudouridine synthase-like protein TruD/Pus7 [Sporormia fimetaria CBS 119925]
MTDTSHTPDRSTSDERPQKRARIEEPTSESATTGLSNPASTTVPTSDAPTPVANNGSDFEKEARAGITEYVCPDRLGFTGTLKRRYTDFLVNEIGLDGEVLHLRNLGVEKRDGKKTEEKVEKKDSVNGEGKDVEMKDAATDVKKAPPAESAETTTEVKTENGEEKKEDTAAQAPQISDEDLKTLQGFFGEEAVFHILKLVQAMRKHPTWKARDFTAITAPSIDDKERRTLAHQALRRIFPNMMESSTEADNSFRIKAAPPAIRGNKKQKAAGRERNQEFRPKGPLAWQELGGEYLHFTLYKENKDTMEVVGYLGSVTGGGSKSYGFAGTKDRRACTVQRVSVKRQTAERMAHVGTRLFNAAIGDFEYKQHDIGLGDLMGNEFVITLRDCHFEKEEGMDFQQRLQLAQQVLAQAVKDFSEKGFINYYGLQRFGSFSNSTDAIGVKLLQGDLKGAVEDLLAYSPIALAAAENTTSTPEVLVSQDDKARAKGLHIWKTTQNGTEALCSIPRKFTAERNIIQHLSSRNGRSGKHDRLHDWQGALMTIPRNLRLMYVHAYQSLVWNVVAGKRWQLFGDKVVEGDLVLVNEHKDKQADAKPAQQDTVDQDGEIIINPSGADSSLAADDAFERARPLSKEEAESGKYNIFDIVLPQPGFDVEYPRNAIGEFYKEFMGSERGGGLDPMNLRRTWRDVSLSGGYRKFLARPLKPIGFEVKTYRDEEVELVVTDLQRIKGGSEKKGEEAKEKGTEKETKMEEGEEKIAVTLSLQLASSQYATMALRELMKEGGVKAFKPEFMGGR